MNKKKYKIAITPLLRRKLKPYITDFRIFEGAFLAATQQLEKEMARATGIKDIEFIWVDGDMVGIGNASRTMPLIHRGEI